jgi:hypothetical protein
MKTILIIFTSIILVFSQENNAIRMDSIIKAKIKMDSLLLFHQIDSINYKKEIIKLDSIEINYAKKDLSNFKNKTGILKGSRNNKEIMSTVMKNIKTIRELYNSRLKENNKLKANLLVKIFIDFKGLVISAECIESTMNDSLFEHKIEQNIRKWKFNEISKKKDTTEINYPFMFAN